MFVFPFFSVTISSRSLLNSCSLIGAEDLTVLGLPLPDLKVIELLALWKEVF
jgi:hypothetical protein